MAQETVANHVRRRREELGLSQGELGAKLGRTRSTVGHIERGKSRRPGLEVAVKLAHALEETFPEFLAATGLEHEYADELKSEQTTDAQDSAIAYIKTHLQGMTPEEYQEVKAMLQIVVRRRLAQSGTLLQGADAGPPDSRPARDAQPPP